MLARSLLAILFLVLTGRPSAAEDAITGFVASAGHLSGSVKDRDGKPLASATVHIVSNVGVEQKVMTDKAGRYQADIVGGDAYVFVEGRVQLGGQVAVIGAGGGNEVIEIREPIAPLVMPKPISSPAFIPEYSDAARDVNTWTRAWLLLAIDETGSVQHLKLLNRPGFDLDPIAIREGFKLKFKPARDRSNRPTRAMILWTFEWPSHRWMTDNDFPLDAVPAGATLVQCKMTASTRSRYRDCSKPNLRLAATQPWLRKPTK